jgi:hypothetical protein
LVAHRSPTNAWLIDAMPGIRPVVLWSAMLPAKDGRVLVPASLKPDADPNRPEQWKPLELSPLRAVIGKPHDSAWFSFQLQSATPEQIAALTRSGAKK